jgi:SAM-dependent methyltransferase
MTTFDEASTINEATTFDETAAVQEAAGHVLGLLIGAATTVMIGIGDRLGLYRVLADGPRTSAALAAATGTHERYVREWCLQQASAGLLVHDGGVFTLPAPTAAVLATADSTAFLAGASLMVEGWYRRTEQVADAFRTGAGIAWHDQHEAVHVGTEQFFAPGYSAQLVPVWLPALDEVVAALESGIRVADVGCGRGVTTVLMAQAFPRSEFVGYDFHEESLGAARTRAAAAGVADRVTFVRADAAGYPGSDFGLVCLFDVLHDLGDPFAAATHARRALAPGGTLMLVEPYAADDAATNVTDPLAALGYTASAFQCLPTSLAQPGGLGLGAQAGRLPVERIVRDAGFATFERVHADPVNAVYAARI